MKGQNTSEIFNARGRVLVYIAQNPGCGIEDIAEGLFVTRRTVWGIVSELKHAGLTRVEKGSPDGRKHRYWVEDEDDLAYHLCQIS